MLSNLVQKVQDKLSNEQTVVIDPATVMLIMTIVSGIISAIKKCKEKPQDGMMLVHHPKEKEKRLLKRHVRKKLGWVRYWKEGEQYCNAILETGRETKLQDIVHAYREVGE